jgi:hypothetical protein
MQDSLDEPDKGLKRKHDEINETDIEKHSLTLFGASPGPSVQPPVYVAFRRGGECSDEEISEWNRLYKLGTRSLEKFKDKYLVGLRDTCDSDQDWIDLLRMCIDANVTSDDFIAAKSNSEAAEKVTATLGIPSDILDDLISGVAKAVRQVAHLELLKKRQLAQLELIEAHGPRLRKAFPSKKSNAECDKDLMGFLCRFELTSLEQIADADLSDITEYFESEDVARKLVKAAKLSGVMLPEAEYLEARIKPVICAYQKPSNVKTQYADSNKVNFGAKNPIFVEELITYMSDSIKPEEREGFSNIKFGYDPDDIVYLLRFFMDLNELTMARNIYNFLFVHVLHLLYKDSEHVTIMNDGEYKSQIPIYLKNGDSEEAGAKANKFVLYDRRNDFMVKYSRQSVTVTLLNGEEKVDRQSYEADHDKALFETLIQWKEFQYVYQNSRDKMEKLVLPFALLHGSTAKFHAVWYDFDSEEFCTTQLLKCDLTSSQGVVAARLAFYRIFVLMRQWVQDLETINLKAFPLRTKLPTIAAATGSKKGTSRSDTNTSKPKQSGAGGKDASKRSSLSCLDDVMVAISMDEGMRAVSSLHIPELSEARETDWDTIDRRLCVFRGCLLGRRVVCKFLPCHNAAQLMCDRIFLERMLYGCEGVVRLLRSGSVQVNAMTFMYNIYEDAGNSAWKAKTFDEWRIYKESLLATLQSVHARDVVHRDITPNNICVDENCLKVTLIDFGFAEAFNPATKKMYRNPDTIGTDGYIAPEDMMGEPRADYYGLVKSLLYAAEGLEDVDEQETAKAQCGNLYEAFVEQHTV